MGRRFEGRSAVVTGAGSGLGEAIAMRLAREGASVGVIDRDQASGERVADAIVTSGGNAVALTADVSQQGEVAAAIAQAASAHGGLHLAVNNAGISLPPASTADQELESWDRIMGINVSGVFYGLKAQIPLILQSGGGAIVNVASIFAFRGLPGHAPYAASKHAVVGLTRSAGLEYCKLGVRINALCPGPFDTSMGRSSGFSEEQVAAMVPAGRAGRPDEAAAAVCFLLSDDAAFVVASEYACDGGLLH
ncbi:SDR family NAD(P)-dependent oxidoreductase [Sphingobium fuliginis]|uniref:Glucose 1-dehydrogenase n=1 Tax=Sphingobium fuliginis ATCC 27551 TaxID=1208342 RepID=A0A5B8CGW2_SPHSA|nr:glucose 1-dehydrogenase [Sphingobium fuliginis]QDC37240.1 glucose 1-dehydrogenase [Sphingobium fuliginis ATCC 27551]